MAEKRPKQYLTVAGRPLIYHALSALCQVEAIKHVFVVLAAADSEWSRHDWRALSGKLRPLYCGGATRAQSVLKGLWAIAAEVAAEDWVLVHDAARPCLTPAHVQSLLDEVSDDEVGGILAVTLADTLKRAGPQRRIAETVSREELWQAQTPQMFRYGVLRRALEKTREVTDESSAVEALDLHPKLIEGDVTNLKVTYPRDLRLAEWILQQRGEEA